MAHVVWERIELAPSLSGSTEDLIVAGILISPKTGMGKIFRCEQLRGLGFAGQRCGRFPMIRRALVGTWPHEGSQRIQWGLR